MSDKINPFGGYSDFSMGGAAGVGGAGGAEKVDKPSQMPQSGDDDQGQFGVATQGQDETSQHVEMAIPPDDEFDAGEFEELSKKGMVQGNNGNL